MAIVIKLYETIENNLAINDKIKIERQNEMPGRIISSTNNCFKEK